MQRYLLDTNAINCDATLFTNDQAFYVTSGLTVQSLQLIPPS